MWEMLKSKSVCYAQIWPTGSVAGGKGQERSQTANIAEWWTGKGGRAAPGLVSHADVIRGLQQTFVAQERLMNPSERLRGRLLSPDHRPPNFFLPFPLLRSLLSGYFLLLSNQK